MISLFLATVISAFLCAKAPVIGLLLNPKAGLESLVAIPWGWGAGAVSLLLINFIGIWWCTLTLPPLIAAAVSYIAAKPS